MFKRILLGILLLLPTTQLVLAHDTWIEKRDGQLLVLRGHHGGTIDAYDPALVKEAKALDAKGQAVEMEIVKNNENATLSTKGNPAVVGALYYSGYWLKTTDGWKKATKREGHGKYNILESSKGEQYLKSVLAPSAESSRSLGQRFEIVPQKDPTTLSPGDTLPIKIFLEGKPLEGAEVTTGGGHESEKKAPLKTDNDGIATVTIARTGPQMVKAKHKIAIKDDPDADVLSLSSSLTFEAK
jgi:nickel transport protein